MALEIEEINATSNRYFDKTMQNMAYDNSPFFAIMKSKNQILLGGGTELQWPMRYKAMSGAGKVSEVDPAAEVTFGVDPSRTAAYLGWRYYFGSTEITWEERVKNQGADSIQLVDLLKDKYEELQEDFQDQFANDLFDVPVGGYDEELSKKFTPLVHIVSEEPFAGIDPADAPKWASHVFDVADWTSLDLYEDDADNKVKSLYKAILAATFGKRKPGFLLTTTDVVSAFKAMLWEKTHYNAPEDAKMADMGFLNLKFENTTMLADPFCPDGYLFGLEMDAFRFFIHPKFNYKTVDWKPLEKKPNNLVKHCSWAGNLVAKRRHTHFVFNGLEM